MDWPGDLSLVAQVKTGWGKMASWHYWHYIDGMITLCGRQPDKLPANVSPRVATSLRCPECEIEQAKRKLPPGHNTQLILDHLDATKGAPLANL